MSNKCSKIILTRKRVFVYNINKNKRSEQVFSVIEEGKRMNKKYILKNRTRFYTFIMIVTVIVSCIFLAVTAYGADTEERYTMVTVEKGDTLWDIAREYNKKGDIRQYIRQIEKINHLSDSMIFEGDVLQLPV